MQAESVKIEMVLMSAVEFEWLKAQGRWTETGDRAVLATVPLGGGCRGVDRYLLPLLHLQIFIKTTATAMHEARGTAQLVEYLPSAHKALGSIPSTV